MPNQWIQFKGILKYGYDYRLVIDVCPELARFYRSFIPKHIRYHITIANRKK